MENQTIEKAINMALANGWKLSIDGKKNYILGEIIGGNLKHDQRMVLFTNDNRTAESILGWEHLFYTHDFAKALWGDEPTEYTNYRVMSASTNSKLQMYGTGILPLWKFHLQQMVIADDPLKYLAENI